MCKATWTYQSNVPWEHKYRRNYRWIWTANKRSVSYFAVHKEDPHIHIVMNENRNLHRTFSTTALLSPIPWALAAVQVYLPRLRKSTFWRTRLWLLTITPADVLVLTSFPVDVGQTCKHLLLPIWIYIIIFRVEWMCLFILSISYR